MAKRSYIKSILSKQSSAYRAERYNAQALHRIDGSSRREISSVGRIKPLINWTISGSGGGSAQADEQAERIMNQGWSRYSNPICSSCWIQKALNGSCNCE